jgi:hypothetical protein
MNAGAVKTNPRTRTQPSCAPIVVSGLHLDQEAKFLEGIRAEACGRVITLHGRLDPAARRLAERLARSVLGAEEVRFEDAA